MYLIPNSSPTSQDYDGAAHGERLALGIAYTPENLPVVEVEATNVAGVTIRVYLSAAQAYGAARVLEDQAAEAETQALAIEAGEAGESAAARLVPCLGCGAPAGQPCQEDCKDPRPQLPEAGTVLCGDRNLCANTYGHAGMHRAFSGKRW